MSEEPNRSPTNAGTILFMLGERFGHPKRFKRRLEQHFGGIFDQIKMRQLIGRKDLYRPSSKELGDKSEFCNKRLKSLNSFEKFRINFKFENI
jgi:hypothetical protein